MTRILLASSSPRRRDLLGSLGFSTRFLAPAISESRRHGESPRNYVIRLARSKAQWGAERARPGETVVAADTAVVLGRVILGKPSGRADHGSKLRRLSGKVHRVLTAVAVHSGERTKISLEESKVRFRRISSETRRAYLRGGEGRDAAGGYAVQGKLSGLLVESVEGSFSNVVGLPLELTLRLIRKVES